MTNSSIDAFSATNLAAEADGRTPLAEGRSNVDVDVAGRSGLPHPARHSITEVTAKNCDRDKASLPPARLRRS
jgi:hypothetical protein